MIIFSSMDERKTLVENAVHSFQQPEKIYGQNEIDAKPCPLPKSGGVYAAYFKELPPDVPSDGCHSYNGLTLLYIGIGKGKKGVRGRVKQHYRGRARKSTLCHSLAVLLSQGADNWLEYGDDRKPRSTQKAKEFLVEWTHKNLFFCWYECSEPETLETNLFAEFSLPLNIEKNDHLFARELKRRRGRIAALLRPKTGSSFCV